MTSFGVATLTSPKRRIQKGRKFDCGRFGQLSANEIAKITGMSREGVWQRVRSGVTGAALCAPKHDGLRKVQKPCKRPVVMVAMKLARAFPDRVPSLDAIRKVHPMCARNAMRWRQAIADSFDAAKQGTE